VNGTGLDHHAGCGCPEHPERLPAPPANPPGRDALDYRVGGHGEFRAAMLAGLRRDPVLRRLGTRESTDPVVALLDSGAAMLDVLTFYQERIANEGFLRTATERGSVRELARAIGYELRPGVAASTALAFTLSQPEQFSPPPGVDLPVAAHAVTTPPVVTIPAGTKAQSVPGPGELPRVFETVAEIEARPEWNALRVPVTEPALPVLGDSDLHLAGAATGLLPGDLLLLVNQERWGAGEAGWWDLRRVTGLQAVERTGRAPAHTVVTLDQPLSQSVPPEPGPAHQHPEVYQLRTRAAIFGHNALPWSALPVALRVGEMVPQPPSTGQPSPPPVWSPGPYAGRQNSWAEATFPAGTTEIFLDRTYPTIVRDSWVVLATPTAAELYQVTAVAELSQADFLLQAQVTRLTLSGYQIELFSPRSTAVFGQSEPLPLAERPVTTSVQGHTIPLAGQVAGLTPGRLVAIRGRLAGPGAGPSAGSGAGALAGRPAGAEASEVRRIAAVLDDGARTTLVLTEDLAGAYLPDTVRVNANVAPATDGAARTEVLGSGDGSVPFQSFPLLDQPLTYVPAATPSGGQSTLEVRVDGALWTEVDTLYGQPGDARVYLTRRAEDGTVTVRFGDGATGARLPTGRDNVVASYRVGTGLAGNLPANRISLLMSRPLGVQDVINPAPAAGADDPEPLARARRNAPTTVLTLDRIVSLRDCQDFASSFLGIGKARASLAWNGQRRVVQLVVATAEGEPVDPTSDLHRHLRDGIDAVRHPNHQVLLVSFQSRPVSVGLKLAVAADRQAEEVFAAVRSALAGGFGFEQREFGQPITASEVLAVVQPVTGVVGAVLVALHLTGTRASRSGLPPTEPTHLLTVSEPDITITELPEPLP
jgi:predicted phage baseplate assembly protein